MAAFDAIVGDIYECVIEPRGWPDVLARMCQAIGGVAGWLAVHYPGQVRSIYEIEVGTDPEQQRRLRSHYVAASPFIGAVHYVARADILSVADVVDYQEFQAGRFYREWAGPQGWIDFIMGVLGREPDRFTWVGVCMGEPVRAEHKARMGLFLPHVERAVRISDLLKLRTDEAADLSAAAEAMTTGMILVDGQFGVRGINAAAERLLRGRGDLRHAGDRLATRSGADGDALNAAVSACAVGSMAGGGATLMLAGAADGHDLLVQVLPLPRTRQSYQGGAVAALFLTEPAQAATLSPEPFAARFGLTPSEVRVALGLLDGRTPRGIAEVQGVSLATVRTHLRRLYDKTGTSGQTALVKLISASIRAV